MRRLKDVGWLFILLFFAFPLTSCWNYDEIEDLDIVAGIAIDRESNQDSYQVTIEVVEITLGENESTLGGKIILGEGETVYDAIRNAIKETGRKLYFSHAKIMIIGKNIAEDGIIPALDWINRDAETRDDTNILIADGKAGEIFLKAKESSKEIISYSLEEEINSVSNLSKAPNSTLWQFLNALESKERTAFLPFIHVDKNNFNHIPTISGLGVFIKDQLVGFLDEDETKTFLFITNEIRGGLFIVDGIYKEGYKKVAFEIFKNNTKVKPKIVDNEIVMEIEIKTHVGVGENMGSKKLTDIGEDGMLEKIADQQLKDKVVQLIKKVQKEYKSDIFGFGQKLNDIMPDVWDGVKEDWEEVFGSIQTEVKSKFIIRDYGVSSNPIEPGI